MPVAPVYAVRHTVHHASQQLDPSLAGAVEAALWAYAPLRASSEEVQVRARGGRVTLEGAVRSSTHKAMAARLAAAVPGVTAVENRIEADNEVEVRVARALAEAPSLAGRGVGLRVKCLAGTVVVAEVPAGTDEAARIEAVVATVPGVRRVLVRTDVFPDCAPASATPEAPDAEASPQARRLEAWRARAAARRAAPSGREGAPPG